MVKQFHLSANLQARSLSSLWSSSSESYGRRRNVNEVDTSIVDDGCNNGARLSMNHRPPWARRTRMALGLGMSPVCDDDDEIGCEVKGRCVWKAEHKVRE
jgi:hypothetical protein